MGSNTLGDRAGQLWTFFASARRGWLGTLLGACVVVATAAGAAAEDLTLTWDGRSYVFRDYTHENAASNPSGNRDVDGRLYVPDDYDPSKRYPVVVFFHGNGEAGTDNRNQVENKSGGVYNGTIHRNLRNLTENARTQGFLLYVPQSPGQYWGAEQMLMTTGVLARIADDYNVDHHRFYATGLSQGGTAVHQAVSAYTDLYAAYANLSTANASSLDAQMGKSRPMWYFHARNDTVIGPGTSRGAVGALITAQGGTVPKWPSSGDFEVSYGNTRYSEYATGGHSPALWNDKVYGDARLYPWLMSNETGFGALEPGRTVAVNFFNDPDAVGGAVTYNLRSRGGDGRQWHNIAKQGMQATLDYVVGYAQDTGGRQTTTSVRLMSAFGGVGTNVTDGVSAFGEDGWLAGRYWVTKPGEAGEFTISGLTPGGAYDLDIFASIAAAGHVGAYSVGDLTAIFDASYNTDEFVRLIGAVADEDGRLVLSVAPAPGSATAVINAFTITAAIPEPATLGLLAVGGVAVAGSSRRRRA